ncbi:MAG: Asp-tRNA(Asn)/Glu-tRNA(Gln) amidotransferase subunit GatB [Proteobacteria bacterium]|nr:Asp-tRNA(Asn)/Glu-tRNA(Gln) amidotransferase subunit GatB [Pseudomonadota bacterium]
MNSRQTEPKESDQGFNGVLARYEPVIGLEVHCQLKTESKLFCACKTSFGALANQNTCPICLGLPGVLPVLNTQAVDFAIRLALAVGAEIRERSVFARKQYFYPDLPKGYQLTQYDLPYCENGKLRLDSGRTIHIQRIHMEEDAGKNIHGDSASYVDLNRAGTPLLEIVSAPEIQSPSEAAEYLRKIRAISRYLDISDGNLDEGSFRCDANISLRPRGSKGLGTRTEIKNLNSFRNIEKAITYEIIRQADVLDAGDRVKQVSLQFDAAVGRTIVMRSKEDSPDYRYFPDPDLGFLSIDQSRIEAIRQAIPELPEQKSDRFQERFKLSEADARQLTAEKELAQFFEDLVMEVGTEVGPKIVANWMLSEYLRELNARQWNLIQPFISARSFSKLLILIGKGTISGKIAKTVFEIMAATGEEAESIIKTKGLVQINDTAAIKAVIAEVLEANPEQVAQYLAGKQKVYGFLVGQVMKVSAGRFNPSLLNDCLKEALHADC